MAKKSKQLKKLEEDLESLEAHAKSLELLIDKAEKSGRINWDLYRETEVVEKRIGDLKAEMKKEED